MVDLTGGLVFVPFQVFQPFYYSHCTSVFLLLDGILLCLPSYYPRTRGRPPSASQVLALEECSVTLSTAPFEALSLVPLFSGTMFPLPLLQGLS